MLMSLRAHDRAVEQLETAKLINPDAPSPRLTLARIYGEVIFSQRRRQCDRGL
jgi:hypothetical protein